MRQTFLAKLYRYSKKGFLCCFLFLLFYLLLLLKNMDMMFFPHNSMFAGYAANKKTYTYCLKINGEVLPITQKLWWKKDFLESNATVYGQYLESGQTSLLEHFIATKVKSGASRQFITERLTAGKVAPFEWASFYIDFAGHTLQSGDEAELMKYELRFTAHQAVVVDSLSIFKFRQP